MTILFRALMSAMGDTPALGQERHWGDLMTELWPVIDAPLTAEGEGLLLYLIRFEGRLQLAVSSEMPHSMSPENMLKSLAIQALARWTGLTYLHEMQKVQLTTQSSSLASLVNDVVQKARETHFADRRMIREEIIESSPGGSIRSVAHPLEWDHGMSYDPRQRIRTNIREPELIS